MDIETELNECRVLNDKGRDEALMRVLERLLEHLKAKHGTK